MGKGRKERAERQNPQVAWGTLCFEREASGVYEK